MKDGFKIPFHHDTISAMFDNEIDDMRQRLIHNSFIFLGNAIVDRDIIRDGEIEYESSIGLNFVYFLGGKIQRRAVMLVCREI